jgi:tRNA-dihydrouridine synthase B
MGLIDDLKNSKTVVMPSPLAGYLDPALASILVSLGVRHIVYPFISSEGIVKRELYRKQVSSKLPQWRSVVPDGCVHYQIFGRDPQIMAETAQYLADHEQADVIDLNMGCSVRKILKSESGSQLLKNLPRALKIIESVLDAVSVPVTVKTRIGWDFGEETGMALIHESASMGVSAVTLHPRYGKQNFSGKAQWDYIKQAAGSVGIPVIGNGDVVTDVDALQMVNQTRCSGVMIGRGSIGNPWIFKQADSLVNKGIKIESPSADEKLSICIQHIELIVKFRGEEVGVKESRKHIGRYLKGLPGASAVRQKVVLENKLDDVKNMLVEYKSRLMENYAGESNEQD